MTMYLIILVLLVTRGIRDVCGTFPLVLDECNKSSKQPHGRIKNSILCDYDPTIRPKVNHQNATKVSFRMVLKSFEYVWNDDHLKWDKLNYDNVDTIYLHSGEIWTPDLFIYNGHGQSDRQSVFNGVNCLVSDRGRVTCVFDVKLEAYCKANLKRYPFDTQNCTLSLGSWVYSGEEINFTFQSPPYLMDGFVVNSEWDLLNISNSKYDGHYKCCPGSTFPSLRYTFTLRRFPGFHGATEIVPALVMILTTLMTLCLNAADMDRLCLVCCNLLSHLLYLQYVSWQLPSVGDDTPLIIIFARDSLLLCTFTLLLTVFLKRVVRCPDESPIWISNGIMWMLGSRAGQIILLLDYNLKSITAAKGEEDGANIIENNENNRGRDCILFAKTLDRLCFVIYFITYFCMFIAFVPEA